MHKVVIISAIALLSSAAIAGPLPLNPDVTQGSIDLTTCMHGWTKTVRPPVLVTSQIKHQLMAEQGLTSFEAAAQVWQEERLL